MYMYMYMSCITVYTHSVFPECGTIYTMYTCICYIHVVCASACTCTCTMVLSNELLYVQIIFLASFPRPVFCSTKLAT